MRLFFFCSKSKVVKSNQVNLLIVFLKRPWVSKEIITQTALLTIFSFFRENSSRRKKEKREEKFGRAAVRYPNKQTRELESLVQSSRRNSSYRLQDSSRTFGGYGWDGVKHTIQRRFPIPRHDWGTPSSLLQYSYNRSEKNYFFSCFEFWQQFSKDLVSWIIFFLHKNHQHWNQAFMHQFSLFHYCFVNTTGYEWPRLPITWSSLHFINNSVI